MGKHERGHVGGLNVFLKLLQKDKFIFKTNIHVSFRRSKFKRLRSFIKELSGISHDISEHFRLKNCVKNV